MRVAVVTNYFPSSAAPWQGRSAFETLRELSKLADVHVFCALAQYPPLLRPATAPAPFLPDWRPPDVAVTYISFPALPIVSRPLNGWLIASALSSAVGRYQPDVILNYVVYPHGFAAVRIAQKLKVPSVLTAIGSDLNRISDRLAGRLTSYSLRHASAVVTVSGDLARTAVRLGANASRTHAILNGCDTSIFFPQDAPAARRRLQLDADAQTVLYVGRLDLRKGLLELVDSFADLRKRTPSCQLVIVGEGPDRQAVLDRIAATGSEDAVKLFGACLPDEVASFIAASDVVTLPSYNEGCPNVVLEALAAGRPVVATRVGGIPELMDDTSGALVPPRNAPELANALQATLARKWSPEDLAARHARSWQQVAQDLYGVLQQATATRK